MVFIVRPLAPEDSISELTALLHRAYKQLADMGLRFVATYQDDDTTRKRISHSECYVAVMDGKIVGTIKLEPPESTGGSPWYDRPDVAGFGQFGVEPELQGMGIGRTLLAKVEERARELGAAELALDTAEPATHLIELYERWGFRIVETVQWGVTNYRSVVMSKSVPSVEVE